MDGLRHTLSEFDIENKLAFCNACDTIVRIKSNGVKKGGLRSQWRCRKKYKMTNNALYFPHRLHKKDSCEACGFIPRHPCQLDVDHIDGDHGNNEVTNLQTVCKNCHALKTQHNKDWETKTLAFGNDK
jgi:hypothetical protein